MNALREGSRIIHFEVEIVGLGLHFCYDFTPACFQCVSGKSVSVRKPNCSDLEEGDNKMQKRNNFTSDEESIPGTHGLGFFFRFLKATHQGIWQTQCSKVRLSQVVSWALKAQ